MVGVLIRAEKPPQNSKRIGFFGPLLANRHKHFFDRFWGNGEDTTADPQTVHSQPVPGADRAIASVRVLQCGRAEQHHEYRYGIFRWSFGRVAKNMALQSRPFF